MSADCNGAVDLVSCASLVLVNSVHPVLSDPYAIENFVHGNPVLQ